MSTEESNVSVFPVSSNELHVVEALKLRDALAALFREAAGPRPGRHKQFHEAMGQAFDLLEAFDNQRHEATP